MKILIVSDLHGSVRATTLVKNLDLENNFDKIICLGDFNYSGARNDCPNDYSPKTCVEIWNELADKVVAIEGNCDSRVDKMVFNFELKPIRILRIENRDVYLTHGDLKFEFLNNLKKNDVLITGHTHIAKMYKNKNGAIILNPGSMTFPKSELGFSYIIYEDGDFKLYQYDYIDNQKIEIKKIFSYNLKDYIE